MQELYCNNLLLDRLGPEITVVQNDALPLSPSSKAVQTNTLRWHRRGVEWRVGVKSRNGGGGVILLAGGGWFEVDVSLRVFFFFPHACCAPLLYAA